MFGYDTIANHYKTNFAMMQHHKYSLTELENMMPWEKFLYVDLLSEHIKKLEQDRRDQEAANKARMKKRR
jgi:hypothetical protein